ncbi:MAG: DUF1707 SHOCT-like domain-containing protein [Solirubrobacteraceae bacterium]
MPDLRASDADRERTVAALRHHAGEGRLTVDELDERSEHAFAAKTLRELSELQADLPAIATRPAVARPRRRPRFPGRFGFTSRWHAPAGAKATMAELVAHVSPPLSRYGYDLIQREDDRLRFECERRPVWTFVLAVFLFPFGLLALLHKERDRITIDLAGDERGTHLVVTGVAPLPVRRAFAELED